MGGACTSVFSDYRDIYVHYVLGVILTINFIFSNLKPIDSQGATTSPTCIFQKSTRILLKKFFNHTVYLITNVHN